MHGFLVRKAEKTHGTGQRIEGFRQKPARVVIVDDVCTTGASTIQAIEAAREFGFEIAGVLCLVEREEAGGRVNVEKAATPAPFIALFTANDVRAEHVKRISQGLSILSEDSFPQSGKESESKDPYTGRKVSVLRGVASTASVATTTSSLRMTHQFALYRD